MPGWIKGKIVKSMCYQELITYGDIDVDNVQNILQAMIGRFYDQYPSVEKREKMLIKAILWRLSHYLYKSWDKEKQEGILRNPKASLALVEHFLKKQK